MLDTEDGVAENNELAALLVGLVTECVGGAPKSGVGPNNDDVAPPDENKSAAPVDGDTFKAIFATETGATLVGAGTESKGEAPNEADVPVIGGPVVGITLGIIFRTGTAEGGAVENKLSAPDTK